MHGRFAPGICRASGPGSVMRDVRHKNMSLSPSILKRSLLAAAMLTLAILGAGIATFSGQVSSNASILQIFYWYILPALPFIALFILALFPSVFQPYMIMGAAFGAVAAIAIPYFLLWISLANYSGGGANIGIGLLFLAMPVYLPFFMLGGSALSRLLHEVYCDPNKTKA